MTEYLDICTEDGIPTGETVERKTAHSTDVCHRTAHVWAIRKVRRIYTVIWHLSLCLTTLFGFLLSKKQSEISKQIKYTGKTHAPDSVRLLIYHLYSKLLYTWL